MKIYEVKWWESGDIQRSWFADEDEGRKFSSELKAHEDCADYGIVAHISFYAHEIPNDVKVFVEWLNRNTN